LIEARAGSAVIALLILSASLPLASQENLQSPAAPANPPVVVTRPNVTFAFERKGLQVPKFRLTIRDDGSAVYEGHEAPEPTRYGPPAAPSLKPFQSSVRVTSATASRIFALAQKLNRFNSTCASKAKNIADTGTKILTYQGADGSGSCTFNYSENKDVQALTEIFQGIAETMDEGRKLDHLHRYDRLGLDSAMSFLAQQASEGHALELGTIASSLGSIAADGELMERVRLRAKSLLALVPADK
jgi:hypothetical protein